MGWKKILLLIIFLQQCFGLSGVLRLQKAGGKMKLEGKVKARVRKSAVSV